MAFDWQQYLDLARYLSDQAGRQADICEAAQRSAVSRAYYAAFCHARNYARDIEAFVPTGTGKDHAVVPDHFKATKPEVSRLLQRLKQWRTTCDYDDTLASSPRQADVHMMMLSAIRHAEEVIKRL